MAEEQSFSAVTARLEQIVEEVRSEDISLDDALKLYEEAVKLGLSACDLSELDILSDASDLSEASDGIEEAEVAGVTGAVVSAVATEAAQVSSTVEASGALDESVSADAEGVN